MRGVVFCLIAASLLSTAIPLPRATMAQDELCQEFESQEQAQAFLDETPAMADSLDPDGDGVACESLLESDATPAPRTSPVATPDSARAEATPVVGLLDARLGGTVESFEAAYDLLANPDARSPFARYRGLPDARDFRVYYQRDRALHIKVISDRAPGTSLDDPDPSHWTLDEADALAQRFLPADAQCGTRQPIDNGLLILCSSAALAEAIDPAIYRESGAAGELGDCRYQFRVAEDGGVSAIIVAIGNEEARANPPSATPAADDEP